MGETAVFYICTTEERARKSFYLVEMRSRSRSFPIICTHRKRKRRRHLQHINTRQKQHGKSLKSYLIHCSGWQNFRSSAGFLCNQLAGASLPGRVLISLHFARERSLSLSRSHSWAEINHWRCIPPKIKLA
jgi:hypothetical protein